MSPKLARISGQQICGILERSGFTLKRVRGSHHIYTRNDIEGYVVVPVHGKEILKPKTLKSIILQAQLDTNEFIR